MNGTGTLDAAGSALSTLIRIRLLKLKEGADVTAAAPWRDVQLAGAKRCTKIR